MYETACATSVHRWQLQIHKVGLGSFSLSLKLNSFNHTTLRDMSEETSTPPGLEALANHLGYTFVKMDPSSSSSSANGDDAEKVTKGVKSEVAEESKDGDEKTEDKKDADSAPSVPVGSLTSCANIYWNKGDDTWTAEEPKNTEPAEGKETIGHAIVLRQQKSSDSRKKYEIHSIVVQSPH